LTETNHERSIRKEKITSADYTWYLIFLGLRANDPPRILSLDFLLLLDQAIKAVKSIEYRVMSARKK
jgi:hypothetical protein